MVTTIKDIAKHANVSIATVSRVLNNDKNLAVANKTRERIISVASELNYIPLRQRKLKTNEKKPQVNKFKIGIVMWCSEEYEWEDTYFLSIRRGIENECNKRGIVVNKIVHLGSVNNIQINSIDGLIFVGKTDKETEDKMREKINKNIIFVNHSPDDEIFDAIVIDYENASKKALDHLFSYGHKKIGFIGGLGADVVGMGNNEDPRRVFYEKYLKEKNVFNSNYIYEVDDYFISDGYKAMKKALEGGALPSAFYIASDAMAIGAMRALQEVDIQVPKDVSIVSFNDIEMASFIKPSLTTIKIYTEEMGKMAVKLLLDRLDGRVIPMKIVAPSYLVVRESTYMKK